MYILLSIILTGSGGISQQVIPMETQQSCEANAALLIKTVKQHSGTFYSGADIMYREVFCLKK
jgi:hypothetical protein